MSSTVENRLSRPDYVMGIEGLKAIAILAVIIYHTKIASFLPGGFTGYDVFFVISGYLISKSLSRKSSLRFPSYLSEFYKARVLRVFPALLISLMGVMIVSTLFIPSAWLSATNKETGLAAFRGVSNFVLLGNTNGFFSPRVEFNPFLHTWSLALVAQFYLLFPPLFYIWLKFNKKSAVFGFVSQGLLWGLALVSLAYAYFETPRYPDQVFYLLSGRFWEFAAGVWLFKLQADNCWITHSKNRASGFLVAGGLLLGVGFVYSRQDLYPFPWALAPVLGTLLFISGVTDTAEPLSFIRKVLQSDFIAFVGKISFSLYLWYWPVTVLFRWTIGFDSVVHKVMGLGLVVLLAVVSHHLIEIPMRINTYLLKQKNWKIIFGGLVGVLASYSVANYVVESQDTLSLSVTKDRYSWYAWDHAISEPSDTSAYADLVGRKIFVIGDSHAAAYRTMLKQVATHLGVEVHIYEQGGCPEAGLLRPISQTMLCKEFYNRTLAEVKNRLQPNDIVFLAALRLPQLSDQFEVIDEAAVVAEFTNETAQKNRQIALEEAGQLIETFSAQKVHVLIDAPMPVLKIPPYRCSDWFNRMNPICAPGFLISREFLLKLRQPVMDSLTILESRYSNLTVWDPFFILCPNETCSAYDGDKSLFFDGDHLSAHGNRKLTPSFESEVLALWRQ